MHYHVAEFIAEVFFLYHGIGESKAQRDATVIESLGDEFHIILVALAVFHTASVPERRRENTVNGSYLHALTEKLRAFFKHGDEHEIEFEFFRKIGQMETYFHFFLLIWIILIVVLPDEKCMDSVNIG